MLKSRLNPSLYVATLLFHPLMGKGYASWVGPCHLVGTTRRIPTHNQTQMTKPSLVVAHAIT